MQTISLNELQAKLREVKGAEEAVITMLTSPAMNKKVNGEINPFYGRVQKRSYRRVVIGLRFGEGHRRWGVQVPDTPLIEHNGKYYLECGVKEILDYYYLLDGELADDEVVEPYLVQRNQSGVPIIDVTLDNIEELVLGGEIYQISKEEN